MRLASLILGSISSTLGLVFGIILKASVGFLSSTLSNFKVEGFYSNETLNLLIWLTVACFAVGLISSSLVMAHPRSAGITMIGASAVGLFFGAGNNFTYIMGGLLLIAGILAVYGAKKQNSRDPVLTEGSWSKDKLGESTAGQGESGGLLSAWWNAGKKKI